MKKLLLLISFLTFGINYSFAGLLDIFGQTNCKSGVEYVYSVTGYDLSKPIEWSSYNGTVVGSNKKSQITIKWNAGVTKGSIEVKATAQGDTEATTRNIAVSVFTEPTVSNLKINARGGSSTYDDVYLDLTYNSNYDFYDKTITWSIDNAGETLTATGKNIKVNFKRAGSTRVTAYLKYNQGSQTYSTSLPMNITEGGLVPILTRIDGTYVTGHRGGGTYYAVSNLGENPDIQYKWYASWPAQIISGQGYSTIECLFTNKTKYDTYCLIKCQAKNIRTGVYGNEVSFNVKVGGGLGMLMAPYDQYAIVQTPGSIVVNKSLNIESQSLSSDNLPITYQIYQLTTGVLIDKGTVNGNSIDTSRLPKGVYVIILNNDTQIESHKFIIK